jgi:hypothetical protein
VADHPISVNAVHRFAGQRTGSAARGAEGEAFAVITDAGDGEVFVTRKASSL